MDLKELVSADSSRHPWEKARRAYFTGAIKRLYTKAPEPHSYLDVGSGDGWFAQGLSETQVTLKDRVCWDTGYSLSTAEEVMRRNAPSFTPTSAQPKNRFDLITLMDVLEHVEDDEAFLRSIVEKNLSPNGHTLISVPCWPKLFSSHDQYLKHYRRYRPKSCADMIGRAGLTIISHGGLFHSLLLPRAISVGIEKGRAGSQKNFDGLGNWKGNSMTTFLVDRVLQADNFVSAIANGLKVNLPGLSWWALCRK